VEPLVLGLKVRSPFGPPSCISVAFELKTFIPVGLGRMKFSA
jgi:hypothetical protein